MPEVHPILNDALDPVSPPAPRSALFWDGTHWHVPRVDDDGRLIVRGEDQLFSYNRPVASRRTALISGIGGFVISDSPAEGFVWIITNVVAQDRDSVTTQHNYYLTAAMGVADFYRQTQAFGIREASFWNGIQCLEHDDTIGVYFIGAPATDDCRIELTGYEMTKE